MTKYFSTLLIALFCFCALAHGTYHHRQFKPRSNTEERCNDIYHLLHSTHAQSRALPHEIKDAKIYAQILKSINQDIILYPSLHRKSIPSFDGLILRDNQVVANYSHKRTVPKSIYEKISSAEKKIINFKKTLYQSTTFTLEEQSQLIALFGYQYLHPRPAQIAIFLDEGNINDFKIHEKFLPIKTRILKSNGLLESISLTRVKSPGTSHTLFFTRDYFLEIETSPEENPKNIVTRHPYP